MKPFLLGLLIAGMLACEKPGDELPDPPAPPPTSPPTSISVNKSHIIFDRFFRVDTITVDTEGEWQVNVEPHSIVFSTRRVDSFPNKFIIDASWETTDGKDVSSTVVVRPVNTTDTAAVYIPVIRLAVPKDTMVFGGEGKDVFNSLAVHHVSREVYAVGYSESSDRDGVGNHGGKDLWLVKLSPEGKKRWSKSYGGSQDDVATSIVPHNNGYLIAGYTWSNDGDVTGNQGQKDAWLIKIDTLGNVIWQKTLGTAGDDEIVAMHNPTSTGTLVSGIKNGDQWIIKLDGNGDVSWEKTFGSSAVDFAGGITETMDGYYFTGSGQLPDGDVTDKPTTSYDAWIVKINHAGQTDWVRYIAGAGDEKGICINGRYSGKVVLVGTTESSDIFPEFSGERNIFAAAFDKDGNILWKKIIKNTSWDEPSSMSNTRFNMIIGGKSLSPGATGNGDDSFDASVFVITEFGDLLFSRTFGGPGPDGINGIEYDGFSKPFVGYSSGSTNSMDVDGYFGWIDYR